MNKYEIYFGTEGLTSTSANHIADLSSHNVESIMRKLESINFLTEKVGLIGSDAEKTLKVGVTEHDMLNIDSMLNEVGEAKALNAWLREAIKAKELLDKQTRNISFDEYVEMNGIELPEEPEKPEEDESMSKDDAIATFSIKDRNRILTLQAMASAYGKYIHPDGSYCNARTKYQKGINNPCSATGEGQNMVIKSWEPSVSEDIIEDVFFKLQQTHRNYQAELNSYMYKIDEMVKTDEMAKTAEYTKKFDDWSAKHQEYNNEVNKIRNQFADWKLHESERISKLKIVIPHDLQDYYNKIAKLGK